MRMVGARGGKEAKQGCICSWKATASQVIFRAEETLFWGMKYLGTSDQWEFFHHLLSRQQKGGCKSHCETACSYRYNLVLGIQLKENSIQCYVLHDWTQFGSEKWREAGTAPSCNICWAQRKAEGCGWTGGSEVHTSSSSCAGQKLTQHKICPTTVRNWANKRIYRNSDKCTIKLPFFFFSCSSLANFNRETEMSRAIWCNKSQEERESVFCRNGEIFYKVQFQSLDEDMEFAHNILHSFFQGKEKSSLHISACQEICILRREPNMAECNRLKIPFKNLGTMWRAGFCLLNIACVPKRKEEHRVIRVW